MSEKEMLRVTEDMGETPQNVNVLAPEGWYGLEARNVTWKSSKKLGQYARVAFVIIDPGEYEGHHVWTNMSPGKHPHVWVQAARSTGLMKGNVVVPELREDVNVPDSVNFMRLIDALVNRQLRGYVVVKPGRDWVDDDGNKKHFDADNDISIRNKPVFEVLMGADGLPVDQPDIPLIPGTDVHLDEDIVDNDI